MVNVMNRLTRKQKENRQKFKKSLASVIERRQSEFDKIWPLMTREEQNQDIANSLFGMHIRQDGNTTILMGSDAMDRYLNFQKQMIEKYKR